MDASAASACNTARKRVKNITFLSTDTWEEFVTSDTVSILFFLWGMDITCRQQIPLVRKFAEDHGETYRIGVIDVLQSPQLTDACNIKQVPSIVVFRQGLILGGRNGGIPEDAEELDEFLARLHVLSRLDMDHQFEIADS